jgi:hypothetical protein
MFSQASFDRRSRLIVAAKGSVASVLRVVAAFLSIQYLRKGRGLSRMLHHAADILAYVVFRKVRDSIGALQLEVPREPDKQLGSKF